jgi:hypothetical protein
VGKPLADFAAGFAKRFKDQTAVPGGEAVVRRLIEEMRSGKPNYDLLTSRYAEVIRAQLTDMQSTIAQLGALQSVAFKGVGPGGADIYTCTFANGAVEFRIWLAPDGKLDNSNIRAI